MVRSRSAGSMVGGIILIGLGLLYLAGQVVGENIMAQAWPLFVLGAGSLFFIGMAAGGPEAARLAIPGSVLSTVGAILLLQNTFGHWESWSYSWTLIVMAVGAGLYIRGWWGHDVESRERGVRILLLGAVLFVVFGSFFELVIGFAGFGVNTQIVWACGLILLGVLLGLRPSNWFGRAR